MKVLIAAAVFVATLAVAAAASAHVTLQPSEAPAGGFARLDVRVPNERDDAGTIKVEVRFPPGFADVSTEPVPGWTVTENKRKLAKPVVTDEGDKLTEEIDTVTWTGDRKAGIIKPGEFQDFGLSVALPDKPGTKLTFKALQTYTGGEVVRWIGGPDAEEPAPQVALTPASPGEHGAAAAAPATAKDDGEDDDGAPVWLVIVALVLGTGGLVAGIAGLARGRRVAA
jgi:periplasmic copper chaperone A